MLTSDIIEVIEIVINVLYNQYELCCNMNFNLID